MFKNQKQRDLYQVYTDARAKAWQIHDKLIKQGLSKNDLREHPDYVDALDSEHRAFHAYRKV